MNAVYQSTSASTEAKSNVDPAVSSSSSTRKVTTLENLAFDNLTLRSLPIEPVEANFIRPKVKNACFSRVKPTPVNNPKVVVVSPDALSELLDLSQEQWERPEFAEYMSGNLILPGSETAAHCYCGHQFGLFSGQLGDGAAMYLGEVVNSKQERWEIQLKGAGLTPYSRNADGRKVLRSSIREFLCSEANFYLGIPTTRAGSVATSDSRVQRDVFYNGNPIQERCTVVLRIAPTFLRFGSFEIFKPTDRQTSREGPSVGNTPLQKQMIQFVTSRFYSEIEAAGKAQGQAEGQIFLSVYREIVERTAKLVAQWQGFGFCHGVLNTDNMSILGITIDYGPYGYMETFDSDYICNASDHSGRYSYRAQPDICKWNLLKLAEAWAPTVPFASAVSVLNEFYDKVYQESYGSLMRRKLGLPSSSATPFVSTDQALIESLLQVMESTGADWSSTFRTLSEVAQGKSTQEVWDKIQPLLSSPAAVAAGLRNKASQIRLAVPPPQLMTLLQMIQTQPERVSQMMEGVPVETIQAELNAELAKVERRKQLIHLADEKQNVSCAVKAKSDHDLWVSWLDRYSSRLHSEGHNLTASLAEMRRVNPAFILRNHVCQLAIDAAERGDYTVVSEVLRLARAPFTDLPEGSPFGFAPSLKANPVT